ncbi:hypothetical protein GPECTOR_41g637 [Gonium pectorale]|uniref:ATP-dependent RNA helicase Ski2/MTR4 C-terminal domain-containing protein n=1 Tax=Gonium pectorale TaxID=33097 RepID=A0A150GA76_GONPE|nr:hypothetical protein GPECTOR_41g637 [Gonium pectorale]|eukprot:KXZ46673.1 hypothetical protein GPECTOR_41g637 [Gonium pectorale]
MFCVVTLKGRAACEIDTADELLASELLLNGTFSGLEPAGLVALASCLIPVCDMMDIFEGSLVRATRRLDELMGQLAAAAAVGDLELAAKIRAAAETIRRDIMFAASLYI